MDVPAAAPDPGGVSPSGRDPIEQFLADVLHTIPPEPRPTTGRPPVLPALVLWSAVLVCLLRGQPRQQAIWRLVSERGLWDWPRVQISDEAIYQRLSRAAHDALRTVFDAITQVFLARPAGRWEQRFAPFATEVVALDESTLDPVRRTLPALRGTAAGDAGRLVGKIAGCFDVRRGLWRAIRTTDQPHQNEKVFARSLVAGLPVGTLVLADLGYFAFRWFDDLTRAGYWWVSRLRQETSHHLVHTLYQRGLPGQEGWVLDALIWLGAHRADRSGYLARLVAFQVNGTCWRYVTNVTDPTVLSIATIVACYRARWTIEQAFLVVKRELSLAFLWSAKPVVVWHQVWAALCLAQILQGLRGLVAQAADVELDDVSLTLLVRNLPLYAREGKDPWPTIIGEGARYGYIRPSTKRRYLVPEVPADALSPPPADLVRTRTPRYAGRRCG